MTKHDALIDHLDKIKKIQQNDISLIKEIFSCESVAKNRFYVRAGDSVESIGFINSGLFRYFYIDFEGNEKTKYFASDGDFVFSLSSFIEKKPSFYFIEALEDSEIVQVRADMLYELIGKIPYWQHVYMKIVEQLYVIKEKREAEFLLYDAKERYQKFVAEYPYIADSVKMHCIASYLGIAPESLSRIRSKI